MTLDAETNKFLKAWQDQPKQQCTYRPTIDCKLPSRNINVVQCQLCLQGQLIDATELQTSAIMEFGIGAI